MSSSVISCRAAVGVVDASESSCSQGADHRQGRSTIDPRPRPPPTPSDRAIRAGLRPTQIARVSPATASTAPERLTRCVPGDGRVRGEEHGDTAVAVVEVGSEDDEL